jgi:hypothetical protein
MQPETPSRRVAAQAALVATPILALISAVLQPDLDGSSREQLAAIGDSNAAAVSAAAFLLMQLPALVAILAIGRLVLPRAPRLSAWGTGLGVLGCFGHTAFGGLSLSYVAMARDASHRTVLADTMDRIQNSPVMLVSVAGLLGTVLGLLLLGIAIFRTRTGPVWVAPALWAFLVVEFLGGSFSSSATYLSSLLLAAAFFALLPQMKEGTLPAADRADVADDLLLT